MIRFRLGQSWKRERGAHPVDAFGLDLDGVNLLSGASEEPLAKLVPELVDAVCALWLDGQTFAQLSLAETHFELLLFRRETEVQLQVVSLGRPAKRLRPTIWVELEDLKDAACKAAKALAEDLAEAAPKLAKAPKIKRMLSRAGTLSRTGLKPQKLPLSQSGYSFRSTAHQPVTFAFSVDDADDLLATYEKDAAAPLASLMFSGRVSLRLLGDGSVWTAESPPFLVAMELARQGEELLHAMDAKDALWKADLAGSKPEIVADLQQGSLKLGGAYHAVTPARLCEAMFELGLSLAMAASARNKAQAKNPYWVELSSRCKEGLSHLKRASATVLPEERPARGKRNRKNAQDKPLKVPGRLRRLRFEKLWDKQRLGGESRGKLKLSKRGPIFSSLEMACGFSHQGELLFRHVSTHGVAVSTEGRVLTATLERVCGYHTHPERAEWLRDHDGLSIGPDLERRDGLLVTTAQGRTTLAFSELTGREIWRLAPPRTQQSHLTLQGHRALLATDAGYLYGLDLADGQVRYRMHAALPFLGPVVPWGKRILATIGRGDRVAVFAADAHAGNIHWTHETTLVGPSQPLVLGSRVYLAGEREEEGWIFCLNRQGGLVWERKLMLGRGPFEILAVNRSIVVSSPTGAAAMVSAEGSVEWLLGSGDAETAECIPPRFARGVLIIPGEVVRAVEPRGGQVLTEVKAGMGLCDLQVDAKLNLYLLDEEGTLQAYRLASTLAVVG